VQFFDDHGPSAMLRVRSYRADMQKPLLSGLSIAVALLVGCASQPPPRSQPSALLGDVMPTFESRTLNGNPLFSGAYEGRRVVVSFVASDCDACDRTLQAAQAMYSNMSDVVVVGVFGPSETASASSVVRQHELRFPVVVDEGGAIAKLFHVDERPTTFVADGYGRVQWVGGSSMTQEGLTSAVRNVN
jgi:peroxiredoxin